MQGRHWFDRDGLRDNVDGKIVFVDTRFFTAVIITIVGYGAIVPVTPQAWLFDTFVVTSIRLFVWLIFLGTAYTFVFQRPWDRIRTRMIEKTLRDQYIVGGFGSGGEAALIVLNARQLNPSIPISASVRAFENEDLLSQASASSIINSASLGGHLLARSSTHRGAVDYIRDPAAADGRVALHERSATPSVVGRSLRSIGSGLGVRLIRAGRPIGFWEEAAETMEAGDAIIAIVAPTEAAPASAP